MAKANSTEAAPHTQQWETGQRGAVWRSDTLADMVHLPTDGHAQSDAQQHARAMLIAAAPDMARALMEIRDAINSGTLGDDAQEVAERALRKAGVLP